MARRGPKIPVKRKPSRPSKGLPKKVRIKKKKRKK